MLDIESILREINSKENESKRNITGIKKLTVVDDKGMHTVKVDSHGNVTVYKGLA